MRTVLCVAASVMGLACLPASARAAGEVGFAAGPAVARHGGKVVITFAASAPTDATVAVVDKAGRVVRHLAAGLLGANAPAPLQKDSLAQRLEWDGNDDAGKPVAAGAVVRVSLGLRPRFARILCEAEQGMASRGPVGLAVDDKGLLYVLEGDTWIQRLGAAGVLQVFSVKAFDAEGNYVRTLVPFRADWPAARVSEVEFVTTTDGRRVPLTGRGGNLPYSGFTPGSPRMTRSQPVVTSAGRLIFPCGEAVAGQRRFISVGADGSTPKELYEGPPLPADCLSGSQLFMALAPDEKTLYFAGAWIKRNGRPTLSHVVYRVGLDGAAPPAVVLGDEFKAGSAPGQFRDPRGVAVDARGRLWVCDYLNDRIGVFDPADQFRLLKTFDVRGPEQVRVHPKTGAVYVLSVRDRGATTNYSTQATWEVYEDKSVVKFISFDDFTEAARIDLPKRKRYMHDCGPMMALDATAAEPILWLASVGRQEPDDFLWKVLDRGGKLVRTPHKVVRLHRHASNSPPLAADRANNEVYAFGSPAGSVRIDPATGQVRKIELAGEAGKAALANVGAAAVGPGGLLYVRSAVILPKNERMWYIRRFDRAGKLAPFAKAGESIETNGKRAGTPWNEQATPFAVGPDGRLYVVGAYSREVNDGHNCRVDVFGADGELATPGLIAMTQSGGCVRVDGQGRLYAADTVRPKDRAFPACYPADPRGNLARWYGTVFRYEPTGGGVTPAPRDQADYLAGGRSVGLSPVVIKGAAWGFYGLGPMPLQTGCQCVMADFDADGWGRLWVPDASGFCVAALDSAGNVITRFGSYGNRDATGACGAIPAPPIPLWSPDRTAALDGDVFVADRLGCRLVQVRLDSAARAEAPVP